MVFEQLPACSNTVIENSSTCHLAYIMPKDTAWCLWNQKKSKHRIDVHVRTSSTSKDTTKLYILRELLETAYYEGQ